MVEWFKAHAWKACDVQKHPEVRILLSPPKETHTKQIERFVSYFYLWDFFGIVVNFERPKINNSGWQNCKTQKRDKYGNFCK